MGEILEISVKCRINKLIDVIDISVLHHMSGNFARIG